MTSKYNLLLIMLTLILSGCYPGISGKVVDGVTNSPLEGAVVLAQWTTTGGLPGLASHSVYKIEETETDKEGQFSISGVYNPFVDEPKMVIYKKGYVPWRNDMDFINPEWTQYDDVIWQNNIVYKLEHWNIGYSKERLSLFVDLMGIDSRNTPKFSVVKSELSNDAQKEVDAKKKIKINRSDK